MDMDVGMDVDVHVWLGVDADVDTPMDAKDVDLSALAASLPGSTGADLANILNQELRPCRAPAPPPHMPVHLHMHHSMLMHGAHTDFRAGGDARGGEWRGGDHGGRRHRGA